MSLTSSHTMIIDGDVLAENFITPNIPARETHLKELQRCLSPALNGHKPLNAWLHGSPGTGKTTVACYALSELKKTTNISGIYVNCWKWNTYYSVLEFMVNELKRGFGDSRDKSVKLHQFERIVDNRPFVIVLDEIDLMNSKERDTMIYNLASITNVGLICISQNRYPLLSLDNRTYSRLNPQVISFEDYSLKELQKILLDRASQSLLSGSWDEEILTTIALKANGDARKAIRILKNSAVHCESDGSGKILLSHVCKAFTDTKEMRRIYQFKNLTEHHKILYKKIEKIPGITSPRLFRSYIKECISRNLKPVAERTFSLYMHKMTELNLVRAERARIRGRVHTFRVC